MQNKKLFDTIGSAFAIQIGYLIAHMLSRIIASIIKKVDFRPVISTIVGFGIPVALTLFKSLKKYDNKLMSLGMFLEGFNGIASMIGNSMNPDEGKKQYSFVELIGKAFNFKVSPDDLTEGSLGNISSPTAYRMGDVIYFTDSRGNVINTVPAPSQPALPDLPYAREQNAYLPEDEYTYEPTYEDFATTDGLNGDALKELFQRANRLSSLSGEKEKDKEEEYNGRKFSSRNFVFNG